MVQAYGGDDVLELFLQVAKTVNFPYKEASLARECDWELCRRLIEQCCAFNEVCLFHLAHVGIYAGFLTYLAPAQLRSKHLRVPSPAAWSTDSTL